MTALAKEAHEASFLQFAKLCLVLSVEKEVISAQQAEDPQRVALVAWLKKYSQYEYSAVCALQNMWLTAWNLGLGGCWVTLDGEITGPLLEIPTNQVIIGGLALGRTRGTPLAHRDSDRKPLSEMVFWEKYGAPDPAQSG